LLASKTIDVGVHQQVTIGGMTFNVDIIVSTIVVAAIVLGLAFAMKRRATDGVPGKLQLIFEMLTVDVVGSLAESSIGEKQFRRFVPLGITLFLVILFSNWMSLLPTALVPGVTHELLPPPTADINLPAAMALFVIVWVHIESFKARGTRGYFAHYREPFLLFIPLNIIEEITKPITLTLRLFGNVFAGGLMVLVITVLFPVYVVPPGELLWKPFDMFIGLIQAYVFMLLSMLYFGMAMTHDDFKHQEKEAAAAKALAEAAQTSN
jgi:F-type H+-transporting ATPase subunit a